FDHLGHAEKISDQDARVADELEEIVQRARKAALPCEYEEKLRTLLLKHRSVFAVDFCVDHQLWDTQPYSEMLRDDDEVHARRPPPRGYQPEADAYLEMTVDKYIECGKMQPFVNDESTARLPVSYSPALVIPKPEKLGQPRKYRLTWDLRAANKRVRPLHYPQPTADAVIDSLMSCTPTAFFSCDIKDAYWQIPIDEKTSVFYTLVTAKRLVQPRSLPQGSRNAPAAFCMKIQETFEDIMADGDMVAFVDDAAGSAPNIEELFRKLERFLTRCMERHIYLSPSKFVAYTKRLPYLGRILTPKGVVPDPDRLKTIRDLQKPADAGALMTYIGMLQFLHQHLPDLSRVMAPLQALKTEALRPQASKKKMHAQKVPLSNLWKPEHDVAFTACQQLIAHAVTLERPADDDQVLLFVDASNESLALLRGLRRRLDLVYRKTMLIAYTDHANLARLAKQVRSPTESTLTVSIITRMALVLSAMPILITHIAGARNQVADYLSRAIGPDTTARLAQIKAGFDINDGGGIVAAEDERAQRMVGNKAYSADAAVTGSEQAPEEEPEVLEESREFQFVDEKGLWDAPAVAPRTVNDGALAISFDFDDARTPGIHVDGKIFPSIEEISQAQGKALLQQGLSPQEQSALESLPTELRTKDRISDDQRTIHGMPTRHRRGLVEVDTKQGWRIWIPAQATNIQARVLVIAHVGEQGHQGAKPTEDIVRKVFWWNNCTRHTRQFLNGCIQCLPTRLGGKVSRPLGETYIPNRPGEAISIDFVQLMARSAGTETSNRYVLVLKCMLTSYVMIEPAARANASATVAGLLRWYQHAGVPRVICSDHGSHFENNVMERFTERLGIQRRWSVAHHPASNGAHERIHRVMKHMLTGILCEKGLTFADFEQVLPMVTHALNARKIKSLGNRSPFELWSGWDSQGPFEALASEDGVQDPTIGRTMSAALQARVTELAEELATARTDAREKLIASRDAGRFQRDKRDKA
ncbi:Retrovirus-related Pol polyprotein from transposon 297, partial [Hondaea fermentalgiana]